MKVDMQSSGFPITTALADHTRRRLRFGLTRQSDRILRVVVRLGDENGPRGGVDKFCRIQVYLVDSPVVVIEEIGPDLYAVIDRAADRVSRVVVKRLDRLQNGRRYGRGDATAASSGKFGAAPTPKYFEGEPA